MLKLFSWIKRYLRAPSKNGEDLEIEINTPGQSYQGTITYKADYEDLLRELKANLNMKILCEYEGGN